MGLSQRRGFGMHFVESGISHIREIAEASIRVIVMLFARQPDGTHPDASMCACLDNLYVTL